MNPRNETTMGKQYRETKFKKPRTFSSQAERIIAKFGNANVLAEAIGYERSTVYRWTYPKKKGGTGGFIPTRAQRHVRYAAKRLGIKLTPSDWFPEADEGPVGEDILD